MKKYYGERVYLNEIEKKDITDDVMKWFKDEELMKFYTSSKQTITKEKLLHSIEEGKSKGNLFTFGIYTIEDNTLIGTIKLGPIHQGHKTSDLVILIGDRNYLGKGLAVEAIKVGNTLAFEEFNIRKLYGGMYESNIPSIKAYTRAGWLVEGRLKGFYSVDNRNEDRILVGCFNPKHFKQEEIDEVSANQKRYLQL
ncbi:GNAT family protein [Zunongwangia sp. F260]|uniref:GNAT family protein n=1 Tax=Autumnicola lenta TaxID=3075593 RepID=A0ABU3CHU1_9FLAO|nr:GNAT family protein [Zunongwangia sp. F260]MDT0645908.1 GNAT family protein [Zunongwangia sp. F260]